MKKYKVKSPDGRTFVINAPAGAAPEALRQKAEQLFSQAKPAGNPQPPNQNPDTASAPQEPNQIQQSLNNIDIPNRLGEAAGIGIAGASKATGIDPLGAITGVNAVPNIGRTVQALKNPGRTMQNLKDVASRAAQATQPGFKPKGDEVAPAVTGRAAASALTSVQPGGMMKGGGKLAKNVGEFVDDSTPLGKSMQHAFNNPAEMFTAPTKQAVKEGYKKAVDAGEEIVRDYSKMTAQKLVKESRATLKNVEERAAKLLDRADKGKDVPPALIIRARKALSEEIGSIKKAVKSGMIDPDTKKPFKQDALFAKLELSKRLNKLLDRIAPNFRTADGMHARQAAVDRLRTKTGAVPGVMASGAGAAYSQVSKAPAAAANVGGTVNRLVYEDAKSAYDKVMEKRSKSKKK